MCEVLSPGTVGKDKIKMPIYAQYEVRYAGSLTPWKKFWKSTVWKGGVWAVAGLYGEGDKVKAEPFQEIEIDLNDLCFSRGLRKARKLKCF